MVTTWNERVRPTTDRGVRTQPETSRNGRVRPITYMTPLEDAYSEVADESDNVIFVLADEGKLIPATFRKKNPLFNS
jgi:hypothetical protein